MRESLRYRGVAAGARQLSWTQLGALPALWRDAESADLRAAAIDAAARLPLTPAAWDRLGERLIELLAEPGQGRPWAAIARAAAHAPLRWVRRAVQDIALDGSHQDWSVATAALSDVGDDVTLARDVVALLREPWSDQAAHRLASLPLERLPSLAARLPRDSGAVTDAGSWWCALASGRAGDTDRLDEWLRRSAEDDSRSPLPHNFSTSAAFRQLLPLPADLVAHLHRAVTAGRPFHDLLASSLFPTVPSAGLGDAPQVYGRWLARGESAAAWPMVAWQLAQVDPANLLTALEPRLIDPDVHIVVTTCRAIADATALHGLPPPVGVLGAPGVLARTSGWAAPTALSGSSRSRASVPERGARPPRSPQQPTAELSAADPRGGDGMRSVVPANMFPEGEPSKPDGYALLACPSAVVVETEFELDIGLADRPARGVVGSALSLPDTASYTLTALIVVDAFRLRAGEQPSVQLSVTDQNPYPSTTVHLTAVVGDDLEVIRSVLVVYSVDGVMVGSATRGILVVPSEGDLPAGAKDVPAIGVDTSVPDNGDHADLTITISRGDDTSGRTLMWSFLSPHNSVIDASQGIAHPFPPNTDQWALKLMRTAGRETGDSLRRLIRGAGGEIAALIPASVMAAIQAVAAPGYAPTVLLLTAETDVPWELATISKPWIGDAFGCLGAQAVIGRWALEEPSPPLPPLDVKMLSMAVVRGGKVVGFSRLLCAEQEADDLHRTYGALVVEAIREPFFQCLDGDPAAQVLHVALHGKFDPTGLQDGLMLTDGAVVSAQQVKGSTLHSSKPFVFLNACQVGQAGEALGHYGGMPQAFIGAGASAVIAPLWAVKDDLARDVALAFYPAVFAGESPAEFLRHGRAETQQNAQSAKHLAYVLYGHPKLRLTDGRPARTWADPGPSAALTGDSNLVCGNLANAEKDPAP